MNEHSVSGSSITRNKVPPPHADSALCKFLTKRINALASIKTQREIASEVGYDRPNVISMIKSGETKLPLDKVPALAKALQVDPKHLFRLALDQQHPEAARIAHELFGNVVTENEMLLIRKFREASEDTDPPPDPELLKVIEKTVKGQTILP
jgi:hypothetical protein